MVPQAQTRISLVVNGERRTFDGPLTVATLIEHLPLPAPRVAVMVNGEVVRRESHAVTALAEGDEVELISMVGGG
jgi:sulfur carrier protein